MDGIELMTKQNWKLRGAMAAGVGAAGGLVSVGSLIGLGIWSQDTLRRPSLLWLPFLARGWRAFCLGR